MKCSRQDGRRNINWSLVKGDPKTSMKNVIEGYVRGNRGKRQNPVSLKQIEKWFFASPKEFVGEALNELVADGRVRIVRNGLRNGKNNASTGYSYEVPEQEN